MHLADGVVNRILIRPGANSRFNSHEASIKIGMIYIFKCCALGTLVNVGLLKVWRLNLVFGKTLNYADFYQNLDGISIYHLNVIILPKKY